MLLKIELIPQPLFGQSLPNTVSRADWDRIRKDTYAQYNYKCGICKKDGRLECHELWQYDDKNHIQKLTGTIALCNMCHHAKHLGFAQKIANEGKLDYDAVIDHYMKVNNCSEPDFYIHKQQAFDLHEKRSKHKWTIDWGKYTSITKK